MGLIEEADRTRTGRHLFDERALRRVEIIKNLNASGYPLREIKGVALGLGDEITPLAELGGPTAERGDGVEHPRVRGLGAVDAEAFPPLTTFQAALRLMPLETAIRMARAARALWALVKFASICVSCGLDRSRFALRFPAVARLW